MSRKILRLPEVIKITGLSRSTIYLYIKEGLFPRNISIGKRSVGWLESEIIGWIDQKSNPNNYGGKDAR